MFEGVFKSLNKLGSKIIGIVRTLILRKGKNATGRTLKSLRQAVEVDFNFIYTLDVYGSIVFRYINDGRKAGSKLPPEGALIKNGWMQARGIPDSKEFLVRRAIAERGIKPFPIIDLTFQQVQKRISGNVSEEIAEGVSDRIQKAIRSDFKFPKIEL